MDDYRKIYPERTVVDSLKGLTSETFWAYDCVGGDHFLTIIEEELDADGNHQYATILATMDLGPCCHHPDFKS